MIVQNKIQKIKDSLNVFRKVLRLLVRCDCKYIIFNLCVTCIKGLIPVTLIIIMRELMNSLQSLQVGLRSTLILAALYIITDLFNTVLSNLDGYYGGKFNLKFSGEIKKVVLEKTEEISLKQFEDPTIYNMIQRAEQGSNGNLFSFYMTHIVVIQQVITLIGTATILIMWKWWMVLAISVIPLILSFKMLKINEEQYLIHRNRTSKDRMIWYISYLLTKDLAFKEIKLNKLHQYFVNKYKDIYKTVVDSEMPILNKRFKFDFIFTILDQVVLGWVFFMIIVDTFNKKIMIGDTMAYISCISKVKDNVSSLLNSLVSIYKDSLYINQLFEFLELPSDYDEKRIYKLEDIQLIEIKNLSYRYKTSQDYVLKDVNLTIKQNEVIGIIGKNGSGKTTLTRILSGFYDDYEGEIFFNGINLKTIEKSSLRKLTAILFQDFPRYEMTVRENIGVGNLKMIEEDKILEDIMRITGITKFLDKGLDTQLGNWFDEGMQLSGGEWQKLAISRVLLKEADFLILDEPTASLDPISEMDLFHNTRSMMHKRISIIISHRMADLERITDRIVILDKGRIIGVGSHNELIKKSDIYKKMYYKSTIDEVS